MNKLLVFLLFLALVSGTSLREKLAHPAMHGDRGAQGDIHGEARGHLKQEAADLDEPEDVDDEEDFDDEEGDEDEEEGFDGLGFFELDSDEDFEDADEDYDESLEEEYA